MAAGPLLLLLLLLPALLPLGLLGALMPGPPAAAATDTCPGCTRPRPADSIRLEAIKLQILTKLGLKAKPHVKRTLPRELVLASLSRAGEDEPEPGAGGSGLAGGSGDTTDPEDDRYTTTTVDSAPDYDDFYGRTSEIITFAEQE